MKRRIAKALNKLANEAPSGRLPTSLVRMAIAEMSHNFVSNCLSFLQ